jgi:hypothetical protein
MPAQYPWLESRKYLLIQIRLLGKKAGMRIVARLLVLLPLLWVEGAWATSYAGYDLSVPLYLNQTYVSLYADNPRGLDPQGLISGVDPVKYSFHEDGTGTIARDSLAGGGNSTGFFFDSFGWSVNPFLNALELKFERGSGDFTTHQFMAGDPDYWFGSGVLVDGYGFDQTELEDLGDFCGDCNLPQLEIIRHTTSISLRPRAGQLWDCEETWQSALVVPQAAIDAGWQGEAELLSRPNTSRAQYYARQYEANLFSQFGDQDIVGQWVLPVYLEDPDSALGLPTGANLFPDRITFFAAGSSTSARAFAERSGLTFEWSLNGTTLTLTNQEIRLDYQLLDKQDSIYLVSFSYLNKTSGLTRDAAYRGAKFDGSGEGVVAEIEVHLPNYYQSLINAVPSFINEVDTSENISGLLFYEPAKALRFFSNPNSSSELPFLSVGGERDVDKRGDTLVLTDDRLNTIGYFRQRFWTVVATLANDRLLVLEKEDFQRYIPRYEHIANRIIVVEKMDLSRAGDAWLRSDFDNDGLTNAEEDEAGTSYGNPDSDSDGFLDGDDNCASFPNADQLNSDSDSDGNACDADDDNDGLPDEQELSLGTDPRKPDTDGDGWSDKEEVDEGTDPLLASSQPEVSNGLPIWLLYQATQ